MQALHNIISMAINPKVNVTHPAQIIAAAFPSKVINLCPHERAVFAALIKFFDVPLTLTNTSTS